MKKLVSFIRLIRAFPLVVAREKAVLAYSAYVTSLMAIAVAVSVTAGAFIIGMPDHATVVRSVFYGFIAGSCVGGFCLVTAHLGMVAGFYIANTWKILRGGRWTSRDNERLRRNTASLRFQPIFPPWVYWQQLRFQVWFASLRRSPRVKVARKVLCPCTVKG